MPANEQVIEVFKEHTKTLCQSMDKHTGSIDSMTAVIVERDKYYQSLMGEVKEQTKILSKAVIDIAESRTRTDNIAVGVKDLCGEVRKLTNQLVEAQKQEAKERAEMKTDIATLQTIQNERWKGVGVAFSACLVISVAASKYLGGA